MDTFSVSKLFPRRKTPFSSFSLTCSSLPWISLLSPGPTTHTLLWNPKGFIDAPLTNAWCTAHPWCWRLDDADFWLSWISACVPEWLDAMSMPFEWYWKPLVFPEFLPPPSISRKAVSFTEFGSFITLWIVVFHWFYLSWTLVVEVPSFAPLK